MLAMLHRRMWRFESIEVLGEVLSPTLTHLDISDTLLALSPALIKTLSAGGRSRALRDIRLDGCHCANKGQVREATPPPSNAF